jgi:hypothetical protein
MGCLYTKLNNSNKYKNLIILDRQDIENINDCISIFNAVNYYK